MVDKVRRGAAKNDSKCVFLFPGKMLAGICTATRLKRHLLGSFALSLNQSDQNRLMSRIQHLWIAIFGLMGMLLIIITHIVRPFLFGSSQEIIFIFGILPNLAAAFSLSYLIFGFYVRMLRGKLWITRHSRIFGLSRFCGMRNTPQLAAQVLGGCVP